MISKGVIDKKTKLDRSRAHLVQRNAGGGDGEIRTLETVSRLHDFQSCALDQLGDISMVEICLFN